MSIDRVYVTEQMSDTPSPTEPGATAGSAYLGRRFLLALGATALVSSCTSAPGVAVHEPNAADASAPSSDMPNSPGDSHPDDPSAVDTASASPSSVGAVATPAPNVCPPVSGVRQKPGGPQHYLPCLGTNIALTIDDGPDRTYTPLILALLDRYKISATFCMIGASAAANPALVARVAGAGHQIANHTYTHPLNLPQLTPGQIRDQIARTSDTLTRLTAGVRPTLFRAPGGMWSPTVLATCKAAGMRPLDWSVDPRAWSQPGVQLRRLTGNSLRAGKGPAWTASAAAIAWILMPAFRPASHQSASAAR